MNSNNNNYRITQFNPITAKRDRVWLIIGSRDSGKTILVKDLLYHTRQHYDFVMGMTATQSTAKMMKTIMPSTNVYCEGYDYGKADAFLEEAKYIINQGRERHILLYMDDVAYDKKILKSDTQTCLHLNGRHYKTTEFNTTQYSMSCPPTVRANVDYVFALKETVKANRRKLYEHYFGVFDSFTEFEKVFHACTENYGALVLNKTLPSSELESCVFWYKANPKLPPFRLGRRVFYQLAHVLEKLRYTSRSKRIRQKTKRIIRHQVK